MGPGGPIGPLSPEKGNRQLGVQGLGEGDQEGQCLCLKTGPPHPRVLTSRLLRHLSAAQAVGHVHQTLPVPSDLLLE